MRQDPGMIIVFSRLYRREMLEPIFVKSICHFTPL